MIVLKRILLLICLVSLALLPAAALADDAGVLSETELNEWIMQVLRDTASTEPLNAPVGEESLTEEGYAFLYSFATLYYNKPVLDENSILMGVAVTDEGYVTPRGLKLGSGEPAIIDAFGWQNPTLVGDGTFAAFYRLSELPRAAYWCWARHDAEWKLEAVQCAIHVQAGDDRYTDAGVSYTLENGVITAIRVYGLNSFVTEAEVRGNLRAVMGVEAAGSGDEMPAPDAAPLPAIAQNDAEPFALSDLSFGGLDFAALTPDDASAVLGEPASSTEALDDTGDVFVNTAWDGAELIWIRSADGSIQPDSLRVTTAALIGPRGLAVGMSLEDVAALFKSEGTQGMLYGDRESAENGVVSQSGGQLQLTYQTAADGQRAYLLQATFENDALEEWVVSISDEH